MSRPLPSAWAELAPPPPQTTGPGTGLALGGGGHLTFPIWTLGTWACSLTPRWGALCARPSAERPGSRGKMVAGSVRASGGGAVRAESRVFERVKPAGAGGPCPRTASPRLQSGSNPSR